MNLEILDNALNSISIILDSLKLPKSQEASLSSKNKFYSIIFLCQIFELSSDIKILIENNSIASTPIILRSITDCLYSLWNMESNPEFINSLAFKSVSEEEKRQRLLNKDPATKEYWDEWKKVFDSEIEPSDYLKYSNIHGNDYIYRMVFSKLSKYVHNDLLTLEKKFCNENDEKIQIKYDVGLADIQAVQKYINFLAVNIYASIISVTTIHGVSGDKYLNILNEILENFSNST